jgi:hypothetical protein
MTCCSLVTSTSSAAIDFNLYAGEPQPAYSLLAAFVLLPLLRRSQIQESSRFAAAIVIKVQRFVYPSHPNRQAITMN